MIYNRTDELRWDLVDVVSKHGFVLCEIKWNPDRKDRGVKWNSLGVGLSLYIHGFPLDHPIDTIRKLVDTSLEGCAQEKVSGHGPVFKWPLIFDKKKGKA